jgi:cell division protein FtsZ
MEDSQEHRVGPRIAVVGVGGAGGNAVDNMIRLGLKGVTFIACNTDAQALHQSLCSEAQRIRLGFGVTQGLGAGASPDVGRSAAEESVDEVMRHLEGIHMLFVTAGMGGGTGTGGAPVIAHAARERGILTVGVVTKPFHFEGINRMKAAEKGIEIIKDCVDTLLVVPNQNLFRLANQATTFAQAFAMADDILYSGVRTFTDLMIKPGLVNLDFADICTVMRNMSGKAMMGTGEASGENRAVEAAEKAIACLLLDDVSIQGARSVLINIAGGADMTLYEVDAAIGHIKEQVEDEMSKKDAYGANAHIIFGATFDAELSGALRVSVVATGIDGDLTSMSALPSQEEAPTDLSETDPLPEASYESVGSRHRDYSFEEQHFSSFSLEEDKEQADYENPPQRKKSFFEKITGFSRHKEVRRPTEISSRARSLLRPEEVVHPAENETVVKIPFDREDDLEVPAFLRKKSKGRPS